MTYPLKIDGFENQDIQYISNGINASAQILVNGEPPIASKNGERWLLTRDDGETVQAFFHRRNIFSNAQALEVDGKAYWPEGISRMEWYQYLWCGIPLVLLFIGGAIGGIFGAIGMFANTRIFYKDEMQPTLKYILTLGISIGVIVLYFVVALIISLLF